MLRFNSEYKMSIEITGVERRRRIIIEHNQVVRAMSFEIVALQVFVSIPESLVNAVVTNGIEILTNKKSSFSTSQHIAMHAVGAHHNVFAKSFGIKISNLIIQVAFGILNHPDRTFADDFLLIFAEMQTMAKNGFT